MEVLVGPTYSMDVSVPSPACVRERSGVAAAQDKVVSSSSSCMFLKGDGGGGEDKLGSAYGSDDSSDSSLSIGDVGGSEEEEAENENEEEVASTKGKELEKHKFSLDLDSLEESLPIKRGLSNHYSGKSKSFANLADVSSVKDLGKTENPFNKRRRVLMANKWSRRSSFYSWQNPKSMPLLPALNEEDDRHQQVQNLSSCKDQDEKEEVVIKTPSTRLNGSRVKIGFKSQSCFSLADLQEEEEQ